MNIAISFDPESNILFSHFGHAPAFKVYAVNNGVIESEKVVNPDGMGHVVMVNTMLENDVQVVICGHMGEHAFVGLKQANIALYKADEENVDVIIKKYLNNELDEITESQPCNHDHEEGHHCCGGCHAPQILFDGKNAGKVVSVHYVGTLNDGTKFDSSIDRGQPLQFTCAIGQMIPGFDQAVVDMEIGETKDIHLSAEEAYGPHDPEQVFEVNIADLPGSEALNVGERIYLSNQFGQQFPVSVTAKTETTITFDANHEMAGKELNFHIELVSIAE